MSFPANASGCYHNSLRFPQHHFHRGRTNFLEEPSHQRIRIRHKGLERVGLGEAVLRLQEVQTSILDHALAKDVREVPGVGFRNALLVLAVCLEPVGDLQEHVSKSQCAYENSQWIPSRSSQCSSATKRRFFHPDTRSSPWSPLGLWKAPRSFRGARTKRRNWCRRGRPPRP